MSAFIVDREHIRFLVEAARQPYHRQPLRWKFDCEIIELLDNDLPGAARMGQLLWAENVLSVQYRYPMDSPERLPGPSDTWPYDYGVHQAIDSCPHPLAVLQACRCYVYQACEHPYWHCSQAKAFIEALEFRQVERLLAQHELPCWQVLDARKATAWRPS